MEREARNPGWALQIGRQGAVTKEKACLIRNRVNVKKPLETARETR
jgi:hypothetical protein